MKSWIKLNWKEHQLFCIVDTKLKLLFSMDSLINTYFTGLERNGYLEDKYCVFHVYIKWRKTQIYFFQIKTAKKCF